MMTTGPPEAFKALSDPTRLRILALLKVRGGSCCDLIGRGEAGLCACDIQGHVGLSQSVINHHMQLLVRAGLVSSEKRGRWVYYRRNESAIAALANTLARDV
jgi:ArsR family transcriptional regulator, arsenate/arsenite/antimonite-responsive transcriptional repressor